jgi:hypothetical protein
MTYFTENIFKNILSYCDDRIEVQQRKHKTNLLADLALLQEDLVSTIIQLHLEDYDYSIDDYVNDDNGVSIVDMFIGSSQENIDGFSSEKTNDFVNVLIEWNY